MPSAATLRRAGDMRCRPHEARSLVVVDLRDFVFFVRKAGPAEAGHHISQTLRTEPESEAGLQGHADAESADRQVADVVEVHLAARVAEEEAGGIARSEQVVAL